MTIPSRWDILQVSWHAASAFDPISYRDLLIPSTAVIHTLGTLFEGARYKTSLRRSTDPFEVIGNLLFEDGNPLRMSAEEKYRTSYQGLNHHSGTSHHVVTFVWILMYFPFISYYCPRHLY